MEGTTYDIEYRAKEDDAWYSVNVNFSGRTLEVMFQGSEAWKLRFTASEFKSIEEVDELSERFRPVSRQLQDNECGKVTNGMKVCAALSYRSDDLLFYDAAVEVVEHKKHSIIDGEEECLCSFLLCWLHGPMSGNYSLVTIANICTIQATTLNNPRISSFSKLAKDIILAGCSKSCIGDEEHNCTSCYSGRNSSSARRLQDNEFESYCHNRIKCKERFSLSSDRGSDEDIGGCDPANSGDCYFVLIDNLEKDLSTSTIRQFILEHTLISPRVYLFPSGLSVVSRGAVASDSKENIEKIYEFLAHSEHLIVSARGRPWVVDEKVLDGTWGATTGSLLSQFQDEFQWPRKEELKVIHSGSDAYNIAKQLRDLFVDLLQHEKLLYQRYALEETALLQCLVQVETIPYR